MTSSRLKCGAETAKRFWRGVFAFRCQMLKEYAYAYTEKQARVMMMRRIAIKQNIPYKLVFNEFRDGRGECRIEEVVKQ